MDRHAEISKMAIENYGSSTPWPDSDVWHRHTYVAEKRIVEEWLGKVANKSMVVLNAGSGGMEYETQSTLVHLDIIESYVNKFEHHLVGSIEDIKLPNESVDGIICVGSVLNYADAQRSISEFSRILKPGGFFILEFERSNSAEFLCTSKHGKMIFSKEYHYNNQTHLLWLYSEKHIRQLLKLYNLQIQQHRRIHVLSSLINRIGVPEERCACFICFDPVLGSISYPFAHNVMLFGAKELMSK